jgi:hypothetical protein
MALRVILPDAADWSDEAVTAIVQPCSEHQASETADTDCRSWRSSAVGTMRVASLHGSCSGTAGRLQGGGEAATSSAAGGSGGGAGRGDGGALARDGSGAGESPSGGAGGG